MRLRVVGLALGLAAAGWLLLGGLERPVLWDDEAETALLGQTVLRVGYPSAREGGFERFWSHARPHWNGRGEWTWLPWLQYYVSALSQALFGATATGARALFAFAGLASVAATWALARSWLGPAGGVWAALLLLSSPVFLIYARNARYYPLVFLLVLAGIEGARRLLERPSAARAALLGLSLGALFHAQYLVCAGVLVGLAGAAIHARFSGRLPGRTAGLASLSLLLAAALSVPWVLYVRPDPFFGGYMTAHLSVVSAPRFLLQLNHFIFPVVLLAAFPLLAFRIGGAGLQGDRIRWALLAWVSAGVFAADVFSPQRHFRYLAPLFPLSAMATSGLIVSLSSWKRAAGPALGAVLLGTRLLQNLPYPLWKGGVVADILRPPVLDFLNERFHPRPRAIDCLVGFFSREARPGETILMVGSGLPLRFHAGLEVSNALLGRIEQTDWILGRSPLSREEGQVELRPDAPGARGVRGTYRRRELECPALDMEASSAEPLAHDFGWGEPGTVTVPVYRWEGLPAL